MMLRCYAPDAAERRRAVGMALVSRLKKLEFSGQPVGVERVSRVLKFARNINCDWVRVTEHAPRGLVRVFERRHGLLDAVGQGH